MRSRVSKAQPKIGAASHGVTMRRPLALKVRKEGHALRTARHGRRLLIETQIRVGARCKVARELIAIPRERTAGAQHDAHQIPGVWNDMTKGVRAKRWIDLGLGQWRQQRSGRPPARHRLAWRNDSHP